MNYQLSPSQIVTILILWFIVGAALDFFKMVLVLGGKYLSFVPKIMKDSSQSTKHNFEGDRNIKAQIVTEFTEAVANSFQGIKNSLLSWSMNFLRQVVKKDDVEGAENLGSKHADVPEKSLSSEVFSVFDNRPENKYAGQKIVGALIEFIALLAFLYADASQAAQTYSVIFSTAKIPAFLNSIVVPLIIASAGTAFILGIFIGDTLRLTHFGNWGDLKGLSRNIFLGVAIGNLLLTIVLSAMIALYRSDVLTQQSEAIKTAAVYAQSLVIVPMLITTTLLLRGAFGIFVILSILLWMLALPFAIIEFFLILLGKLIGLGVISLDFVFSKVALLVLNVSELIFNVLEKSIQGSFLVLISLITVVFYIPYLLINIPIEKITKGRRIRSFFDELNNLDLGVANDVEDGK